MNTCIPAQDATAGGLFQVQGQPGMGSEATGVVLGRDRDRLKSSRCPVCLVLLSGIV